MNGIYELMDGLAEYKAKMLHRIPDVPVVGREKFLLERATGKVVLDIGASGPMSDAIKRVAKEYHSLDRDGAEFCIDLDSASVLPVIAGLELVIMGEVIEHLSNPGYVLDLIRYYYSMPIILTTPNAFSATGHYYAQKGIESVNPEHVCWYSYHTLKVLVERHGYNISEWYWYKGKPLTAEGLIFCLEGRKDA